MSARSRTNQLLYQAELILSMPVGDDEHSPARQQAIEESALALFELALNSMLKEVSQHARLETHAWPQLLASHGPEVAELERLRDLRGRTDNWLGWLVAQLERLHSDDGAARRSIQNPAMIALEGQTTLSDQLQGNLQAAKQELALLRESSQEW